MRSSIPLQNSRKCVQGLGPQNRRSPQSNHVARRKQRVLFGPHVKVAWAAMPSSINAEVKPNKRGVARGHCRTAHSVVRKDADRHRAVRSGRLGVRVRRCATRPGGAAGGRGRGDEGERGQGGI